MATEEIKTEEVVEEAEVKEETVEKKKMTETYNELPQFWKIVIQFCLGWPVCGLYRILRYTQTKTTSTLVAGILALIPPVTFLFYAMDFITTVTKNRIEFFAD